MLKNHWRLKNTLLLGFALIYGIAIHGRRINSDREKVLFFFLQISITALEKKSPRGEYILLTLFTNTDYIEGFMSKLSLFETKDKYILTLIQVQDYTIQTFF